MQQHLIDELKRDSDASEETWQERLDFYREMEEYEINQGVSFDEPTPDIVLDFLNGLRRSNIHTVQKDLQLVRVYTDKANASENFKDITAMDVDLTQGIRRELVPSINELYRRVRLIAQPYDGNYLFPVCSFAWMGLSLTETLSLKTSQVDLKTGVIVTQTKLTYPVMPDEMLTVLREYRNPQSYYGNNRHTVVSDQNERKEFVYKMLSLNDKRRGTKIRVNVMSGKFDEMNERCGDGVDLKYSGVVRSGKFYRLYQMEKSGIDWNDLSNNSLLQSVYNTNRLEPSYLRHNYNAYKQAFNLT